MAEDPRASRSLDALIAAAARLVEQKEVADISVTELVAEAGVSRPTFYQYFADVPAVVAAAAIQRLEGLFAGSDTRTAGCDDLAFTRGMIGALVDGLHEERVFFQRVLSGATSFQTLGSVIGLLESRMRARLADAPFAAGRTPTEFADHVTAVSAGLAWLGTQWLASDFRGENAPAAMAARLVSLVAEFNGFEEAA